MAITTMITMSACAKINNDTANKVCKALEEKYGEPFVASKIGDRLNTNAAKLYVYPEKNEEILFTATIDKDTGKVTDNYLLEVVNNDIEKILCNHFSTEMIEVYAQCMVITKDSLNISIDNYTPASLQEKYGFDHFSVYLIMDKQNVSAKKIENALVNANKAIGVKLLVTGYIFDTKNYEACLAKMKENPEISTAIIEKEVPLSSFDVMIENESCSMSIEELTNTIEGI